MSVWLTMVTVKVPAQIPLAPLSVVVLQASNLI